MVEDPAAGIVVLAVDLVRGSRLTPGYLDVAARVHDSIEKPLAIMGNLASAIDAKAAARARSRGIPVLMGTDTALAALRHALTWEPAVPAHHTPPYDAALAARWSERLSTHGGVLDEAEAKTLLSEWGVPVVAERLVDDEEAALGAARTLGCPVVLKTAAPGVLHKSDVGGVLLNVNDEAAARSAYRRLGERFGPRVLVQRQIPADDSVEFFLGMTVDAQFGPLVSFGLGGIWVETLRDVVFALPPIDPEKARHLVLRLRGAPLLLGARGRSPVDVDALAGAIAAFSRMAAALGQVLTEVDVNPLLAGPNGVVAVDALVVARRPHHIPNPSNSKPRSPRTG